MKASLRIKRCYQLNRTQVRKEADLKYPLAKAIVNAMTQQCRERYQYIVTCETAYQVVHISKRRCLRGRKSRPCVSSIAS